MHVRVMHQRDEPTKLSGKIHVAIVGTGLAGLTTAYLLQHDRENRYHVTLFEQGEKVSLDAASVNFKDEKTGIIERIDVPLRSFSKRYYRNLYRMYNHLGIASQPVSLTWVFAKPCTKPQPQIVWAKTPEALPGNYFVYGKRLREMLLLSPLFWLSPLRQIAQTLLLSICHIWFYTSCFLVVPSITQPMNPNMDTAPLRSEIDTETLGSYLRRTRQPRFYVDDYLLPVLSGICGCSHSEMLDFPATDIVQFMKAMFLQKTYVNRGGIQMVQSALCRGLEDIRLRSRVTEVSRVDQGVSVCWEEIREEKRLAREETFDRVVLAVAPTVAAKIFGPSKSQLAVIPTASVTSSISGPPSGGMSLMRDDGKDTLNKGYYRRGDTQIMAFNTVCLNHVTHSEALHFLPSELIVKTSSSGHTEEIPHKLYSATFTRTLRSSESRRVTRRLMDNDEMTHDGSLINDVENNYEAWRNGQDHVWMAGSWCWDGLVLLEGCVVSAMRVAQDFGVTIPWQAEPLRY